MEVRGYCPAAPLTEDTELPGLALVQHLPSHLQGSRTQEATPVVLSTGIQRQLGTGGWRLSWGPVQRHHSSSMGLALYAHYSPLRDLELVSEVWEWTVVISECQAGSWEA